jgi:hypothetical protein
MAIQRANIISGPGSVSLGAVRLYDRDGIQAAVVVDSFDGVTSAFGVVNKFRRDRRVEVSFTPCGRCTAPILAALFPHQNPVIGTDPFGATDTAAIIHSLAGTKLTLHAAALTRVPSLKLSTSATAFGGAAQIIGILKNDTAPTADNSLYTVASEAFAGTYDPAEMRGGVYIGTWNPGDGAVTLTTADGWTVEVDLAMAPLYVDGHGTARYELTGVTVRARCQPVGVSEATVLGWLRLQGASAGIGASMLSGNDLVIAAAGGLTVTLKQAVLVAGPMAWGAGTLRIGELGWVAHRAVESNTMGTLYTVALSA